MKIKLKDGNTTVTVDNSGLEALIKEIVDQRFPDVFKKIADGVADIQLNAADEWPVRTGTSKDGLDSVVTVSDSKIAAGIESSAPYTVYIKSYKNGLQGKSAYIELLKKPYDKLVKELIKDIGPIIAGKKGNS